jgi:TRAP-type C4-dicarboxylate transport system permease small subunit
MFSKTDRLLRKMEIILTGVSWSVALLVTFLIVTDVFLRYFFNRPLPATWEISEILMPYIVFFPFAYTLTLDAHVRVSLIKERLSPRVQLSFEIITNLISFLLCVAITYWSWLNFRQSFAIGDEIMAAIRLPWWVGKMSMPIGMGLFAMRYLVLLIYNLTQKEIVQRKGI